MRPLTLSPPHSGLRTPLPPAARADDAATVFAFASPGNQAATGPLERFAALLRQGQGAGGRAGGRAGRRDLYGGVRQ